MTANQNFDDSSLPTADYFRLADDSPVMRNCASLDASGAPMSQDASEMACDEFQSLLGELVNSGADIEDHPHAKACATCRLLVQDLEAIAEEARKRSPPEWSDVPWWPR